MRAELHYKTDNRTVSLRDVYYALKNMFRDQRECNACILQVGRLLKLKRCKWPLARYSSRYSLTVLIRRYR
jgi:DNA topoisomerase VI subunit A